MEILYFIESIIEKISAFGNQVFFFNITGNAKYTVPFLIAWITIFGIYCTIKFRFINIKYFVKSLKLMMSSHIDKAQMKQKNLFNLSTSRRILLTGIGEAIDVSAIFGITTGVIIGGPGVLFWMLLAGFISMPIKFLEISLGCITRKMDKNNGCVIGGPSRYIQVMFRCIGQRKFGRFIAIIFSFFVMFSTFFSLQINQTMNVIRHIFEIPDFTLMQINILVASLIMLIILTGFTSITKISSKIVKIMSIFYVLVCLAIIIKNADKLPSSLLSIFTDAFSFRAIEGSIIFASIVGLKRIYFSCDVGQGISSIIHINTLNKNPIQEGIISMSAITIITLISVFCSGLIVVITGSYLSNTESMNAVIFAFDTVHPLLKYTLFIVVPMFAITTAVAWGYVGQNAWKNIFGIKTVIIYNILLFASYIFCGTTKDFRKILDIADIFNFAITIPNIIALFIGANFVLKRYLKYKS